MNSLESLLYAADLAESLDTAGSALAHAPRHPGAPRDLAFGSAELRAARAPESKSESVARASRAASRSASVKQELARRRLGRPPASASSSPELVATPAVRCDDAPPVVLLTQVGSIVYNSVRTASDRLDSSPLRLLFAVSPQFMEVVSATARDLEAQARAHGLRVGCNYTEALRRLVTCEVVYFNYNLPMHFVGPLPEDDDDDRAGGGGSGASSSASIGTSGASHASREEGFMSPLPPPDIKFALHLDSRPGASPIEASSASSTCSDYSDHRDKVSEAHALLPPGHSLLSASIERRFPLSSSHGNQPFRMAFVFGDYLVATPPFTVMAKKGKRGSGMKRIKRSQASQMSSSRNRALAIIRTKAKESLLQYAGGHDSLPPSVPDSPAAIACHPADAGGHGLLRADDSSSRLDDPGNGAEWDEGLHPPRMRPLPRPTRDLALPLRTHRLAPPLPPRPRVVYFTGPASASASAPGSTVSSASATPTFSAALLPAPVATAAATAAATGPSAGAATAPASSATSSAGPASTPATPVSAPAASASAPAAPATAPAAPAEAEAPPAATASGFLPGRPPPVDIGVPHPPSHAAAHAEAAAPAPSPHRAKRGWAEYASHNPESPSGRRAPGAFSDAPLGGSSDTGFTYAGGNAGVRPAAAAATQPSTPGADGPRPRLVARTPDKAPFGVYVKHPAEREPAQSLEAAAMARESALRALGSAPHEVSLCDALLGTPHAEYAIRAAPIASRRLAAGHALTSATLGDVFAAPARRFPC